MVACCLILPCLRPGMQFVAQVLLPSALDWVASLCTLAPVLLPCPPASATAALPRKTRSTLHSAINPTCFPGCPHPLSLRSGGKSGGLRRHRLESGRRMAAEVPFAQQHPLAAGVLVG